MNLYLCLLLVVLISTICSRWAYIRGVQVGNQNSTHLVRELARANSFATEQLLHDDE